MTERQPTPGVHENFAEDLSPLPPANVLHLTCPTWQSMDSAPKDRDILVETADFGIIQARWDPSVTNFYKSQEGWASFDPDNAKGDWVADFCTPGDTDRRLYCGATPGRWAELPSYEAPPPPGSRLRGIVEAFLHAHFDGPGLIDAVDNYGDRYTSQFLADTIERARAALATTEGSAE